MAQQSRVGGERRSSVLAAFLFCRVAPKAAVQFESSKFRFFRIPDFGVRCSEWPLPALSTETDTDR